MTRQPMSSSRLIVLVLPRPEEFSVNAQIMAADTGERETQHRQAVARQPAPGWRGAGGPFGVFLRIESGQAFVPPAYEVVDDDASTIANTTAMPALSRGLRCNQGTELASKPIPMKKGHPGHTRDGAQQEEPAARD